MDMLPARRAASTPILPSTREHSDNDGPPAPLHTSAVLEVEANNPQNPELDAEAPGPHIVEVDTVETILEMYSQDLVGELEGENIYVAER